MWLSHSPSRTERRASHRLRPHFLVFEERKLLSVTGLDVASSAAPSALTSAANPTNGKHPLSDVPALSSLPGARDSIYLNFLGDYVPKYGKWTNITIPAYDQDGDISTFTDGELASIRIVWSVVAEDYAPFNINVTTVLPSDMSHGVSVKADIGGDGAWTGGKYGGISLVNAFVMSGIPNISFAFSANFVSNGVPGEPGNTGDATSHELGHAFGLSHQSTYSGSTLVQEYSTGPGNGTAPLMGSSYAAARSLWWYGTSENSPTSYQDDMAILAGATNGFGYRALPANTTAAAAAAMTVQNSTQLRASGLIIHSTDQNYFTFTASAGLVGFTVSVNTGVNNLAPRVVLLDANGSTVIASAGPSFSDFSASVTATLPSSGTYLLMVTSSDGGYGNVGNYTIQGTIGAAAPPASPGGSGGTASGSTTGSATLAAPLGLAAAAASPNQINLSWGSVIGAAGYLVSRTTDGVTWENVGVTGAGITTFSDSSLGPQTTRAYVVSALSGSLVSAPSSPVWVTSPAYTAAPRAVSSLTVTSRAARQIVLGWLSVSGAEGFQIERSTNGRNWTVVGRTGAGSTAFADASVAPNRMYQYRIRAYNAAGSASASPTIRVATPRAAAVRPLRRKP